MNSVYFDILLILYFRSTIEFSIDLLLMHNIDNVMQQKLQFFFQLFQLLWIFRMMKFQMFQDIFLVHVNLLTFIIDAIVSPAKMQRFSVTLEKFFLITAECTIWALDSHSISMRDFDVNSELMFSDECF